MRIKFVAVLVLVTGILARSLYSVPENGTQVTQLLTRSDSVLSSKSVGTQNTYFTIAVQDSFQEVESDEWSSYPPS
jgi:hypothetical protein